VIRELRADGLAAVELASTLLRRVRLADPDAGMWEPADVQWWWRMPRRSDTFEQLFLVDGESPVAAVLATEFRGTWQCDVIRMPDVPLDAVWPRALETVRALGPEPVEVPVRDDDHELVGCVVGAGLVPGDRDATAWMAAEERAPVAAPLDGFVLVDRRSTNDKPHPMRGRNGEGVEERLNQVSLYDPELDLAVETADGEVAGYALFWLDPSTRVGLLEPMRVEDRFQRRGLGLSLTTMGLDRLANRGACRLKVSYSSEIAGALYRGAGFRTTETSTWYRART
jgi:ribosomal protein S18 acetylase RimI-like enzyme